MNGATEQTLAELLATANAMNVNLVKLNKLVAGLNSSNVSGSSAKAASDGLNEIGKSAGPLAKTMSVIGKAGDAVGAVFSKLGGVIGYTVGVVSNVASNLVEFGVKAAEGTAKLSDLYAAFKDLPFGLGTLASIFAQIVRYAENLLVTYQKLSAAGASFSGDLFAMRAAAARAQMSMDEFAEVVNNNSEFFSTMGGNVQAGIDKFVLAQGALMGPQSPYAQSILGLGVTAQEASQFLVSMMKSQGVMGKQGAADAATLARYTAEYITELDELSKITGKRREQIDAEVQKAEQDDAWQLFMDSLTPDENAKAKTMLAIAETYNGKAGVEQMKLSLRGIDAPIGKLSQGLAVASGGISTSGEQYRKALRDGSISVEQAGKATTRGQLEIAAGVGKFAKTIGTEGLAAGAGINFLNSASVATARKLDAAGGSQEKMIAMAKKQQEDQAKGSAAQLAQAQQSIRNLGNTIMEFVTNLVGPGAGKLIEFGHSVVQAINAFMQTEEFKKTVKDVTDWFVTAFSDLKAAYAEGGFKAAFQKFIEKMIEGIQNVWKVVGPPIIEGFKKMWAALEPVIIEGFRHLFNLMGKAIGLNVGETKDEEAKREKVERSLDAQISEEATGIEAVQRLPAQLIEGIGTLLGKIPGLSVFEELASGAKSSRLAEEAEYLRSKGRLPAAEQPKPKASGGPISAGAYLVGEKGPELINTNKSGEVITNENLTAMIANLKNNNLQQGIEQLNTLVSQLLRAQQENNEFARRQLDAVKGLDGNLFA